MDALYLIDFPARVLAGQPVDLLAGFGAQLAWIVLLLPLVLLLWRAGVRLQRHGGLMGRYWRTLRRFWGTAVAVQLEYQANILIELLAVAMSLSGSLFLLSLFYGPDPTLGLELGRGSDGAGSLQRI